MAKSKVLIPLDGSEFSRQIIDAVRAILGPEQCELVLLRVGETQQGHVGLPPRPATADVPVPMYASAADVEFTQHPVFASQEYESATSELLDELRSDREQLAASGYTVNAAVLFGNPGHEIASYVSRQGIALVAMTTHGRSGLSRLVSGSVAEHVLRHVTVPVMLVKPTEQTPSDDNPPSEATPGEPGARR